MIYRASYRNPDGDLTTVPSRAGLHTYGYWHPLFRYPGNHPRGRALGGNRGLHRLHRRRRQERWDIPGTDDNGGCPLLQASGRIGRRSQPGGERGIHHHFRAAFCRGGAKTVFGSLFTGQVDQKKSTITGISMVLGLSAGISAD